MNLTSFFFNTFLEDSSQFEVQFIFFGLGVFIASTFVVMGEPKGSVLNDLQSRLNCEISRLKNLLENKNEQLLEAGLIIKNQEDLLKRHDLIKDPIQVTEKDLFEKLINSVLLTESNWVDFRETFQELYPRFFTSLKLKQPDLTEGEKRLAVLIKLKFKNKEMGRMLGISTNSIVKSRYRLKKKLVILTQSDFLLDEYIQSV